MFRFLHRLIKQLSVSHKPFLINTLDFVAVIFISSILSMIFEGWLGEDVNGITASYAEAMVAGELALMAALDPSRYVLSVATDALNYGTWQPAMEPGEDAMSEIRRVSSRTKLPVHAFWLQGGLVEN